MASLEGAWEHALSRPPRGAPYPLLKTMLSVFEKPKQMSYRLLFMLSLRALEDHLDSSTIEDGVLKCLVEQQTYTKSSDLASLGLPSAAALLLAVKVELTLQHLRPGVDDWQSFLQALTVHWDGGANESSSDTSRAAATRLANELQSLRETPILAHQTLKKYPVDLLRQRLMTYIMDCWQALATSTSQGEGSPDLIAREREGPEPASGLKATPPKARMKTTVRTRAEAAAAAESPPLEELHHLGVPPSARRSGADWRPLRSGVRYVDLAPLAEAGEETPPRRMTARRRRQVEASEPAVGEEGAGLIRAEKRVKVEYSDVRTSEEEVHNDEVDVEEVHLITRRRPGAPLEEEDAVALRKLRHSSRELRRTGTDPLPEALTTAASIQILVSPPAPPRGVRAAASPAQDAPRPDENHSAGRSDERQRGGPILLNRRRKAARPVQWGGGESEEETGDVHGEEYGTGKDGAGRKDPGGAEGVEDRHEGDAAEQHMAPEEGLAAGHLGRNEVHKEGPGEGDASPGPALPSHAPRPVSPLEGDPAPAAASPLVGGRRARKRWTAEETEALQAAVQKHGKGKWALIKVDPKFSDILEDRSDVDLKDKWRNIAKYGSAK